MFTFWFVTALLAAVTAAYVWLALVARSGGKAAVPQPSRQADVVGVPTQAVTLSV